MELESFVDLHTHGIGQYDTTSGDYTHILKMAEIHGSAGTEAILPSIYPGSIEEMRMHMETVRQAIEFQRAASGAVPCAQDLASAPCRPARIFGIHLEGPFLNPKRCGALEEKSFLRPSLSSLRKLISGYETIIKIITIAPEMPGSLKVIGKCAEMGIRVNMGHSEATYAQAIEGKKAGATGITHLFNAMRPFHHREPGLAGLGLIDEDLYIEVIADGIHIHPKTLELIFNRKRLDRIMLVSDSVKSSGKKGKPVYASKGVLAGSGITVWDAVCVLRDIGIPDAEIVEAAADNPARYLGLKR